jgi:PAS domain S-box-containing protein
VDSSKTAAESLAASERRLVAQSDALTELTARYTGAAEHFIDRLHSILEISARALQVERLSMWEFGDGHSSIRCVGLYHRTTDCHESGAVLQRRDFPGYFDAIDRERVVAAEDARTDPRTAGFRDMYLNPNGIGAMLDVPLQRDHGRIGVLCAEHVGPARHWTVDEQNFAIAVANLVVAAIADDERRAALSRLAESDARARMIVDTAHDAYIGIDSEGRIGVWNAQAEATFGWKREEIIGKLLAETIIPPGFRDGHNNGMRRFHETGEAPVVNQRLELSALDKSGREFPIELTVTSPLRVENGYFFGAFLRDISGRLERDAELRRAKDAAEAATRAKSEFLTNMSHELRTPLNGVLGYAQLLQRDRGLSAPQRDALEAIAKCGSQLLDLINDVLDLAKIEAGRLDIEETPTDLARLALDLKLVVGEAVERKGLELTTFVDPEIPRSVNLDGRRLRQVLVNLLGNAIKFTDEGRVRLGITRSNGVLRFEVIDTGWGIEPEAVTQIFAAFAQTTSGAAAGGTGLGLAICDRLITGMGGQLNVESTVGAGSRFWFELPLVPGRPTTRSEPEDAESALPPFDARLAPGQQISAMIVDDTTANRHIMASLLESAGVHVITAADGLEAIERTRTDRPHIIFMDLKMSGLDGLEAARRLSRDPSTSSIPIVAVTASALGNSRQRSRDAGCVDYLAKPVRAQQLFGMLQTHLGATFVSESASVITRAADVAPLDRRTEIGGQLRHAVSLGDVGAIQDLARHLMNGPPAEAALGERINRLVTSFDFDGLSELVGSLES